MSQPIFQSQSLNDWLFYLEQQHPTEIELGLTRIDQVASRANVKDLKAGKTVLVAGTNGKGTTIRFMELMLIKMGFNVGVFSSPHLFEYNERVRVNGDVLCDQVHVDAFDYIEQHKGETSLTYFEFSTLAAFKIFKDQQLDFVLIEVGLGGRLDSTNIINQDLSIITSIGLDHTDWLGDSLDSIGFEKAGIFKPENIAIVGEPNPPKSIAKQAIDLKVSLLWNSGTDFKFEYINEQSDLKRFWQYKFKELSFDKLESNFVPLDNLATALTALIELKTDPTERLINECLTSFSLTGRMQIVNQSPLRLVDVAHNPHAVTYLAQTIKNVAPFNRKTTCSAVIGMMKDKDIRATLETIFPQVQTWYLGELKGNKRAAQTAYIRTILEDLGAENIYEYESIKEAWQSAAENQSEEALLLGFGSFYTVCEILEQSKI